VVDQRHRKRSWLPLLLHTTPHTYTHMHTYTQIHTDTHTHIDTMSIVSAEEENARLSVEGHTRPTQHSRWWVSPRRESRFRKLLILKEPCTWRQWTFQLRNTDTVSECWQPSVRRHACCQRTGVLATSYQRRHTPDNEINSCADGANRKKTRNSTPIHHTHTHPSIDTYAHTNATKKCSTLRKWAHKPRRGTHHRKQLLGGYLSSSDQRPS
jgi:hypothetical protein